MVAPADRKVCVKQSLTFVSFVPWEAWEASSWKTYRTKTEGHAFYSAAETAGGNVPSAGAPCPLQSTWEVVPRKLGAQLHPSSCHDTRTGTGDSVCILPKDLSARITEVLSRNDLGSRLLISFRGDQGPHLSLGH